MWLGMVLAVSFLEAPLKFRAPGVTVRVGLGIGRLVFRALNGVEAVFAAVLVAVALLGAVPVPVPALAAAGVLAVQLLAVRPGLNRRSDAVLAGEEAPRSRAHLVYVVLEVLKAAALLTGGVLLLAG
ncbi:hypothetical protein SAMN05421803_110162 [Nocardiopsis flavescens]|uniref:Uncharacterized protein n=1 Tax=Nocardiopsis flavescens TaxID=758803 RepID=A0A1M6MQI9_9ACTN|nr:hypothetical protein SAMN05421803_110162 [Nocardiopsis flavescens]